MSSRARQREVVAIALVAGVLAAGTAVFGGVWLARAIDDTPPVDGEFVLEQPGVYQQPLEEVNADATGDLVPDAGLVDVDGAPVRLSEFRGEPLVVNLWFANCPPCRRELADFAEVHADVGDRVRFVGVDPFDTVDAMQRFAGERGVEYQLLRDPEREFTNAVGVVAFPVTLFVDEAGRILRQTGEIDAAELRSIIAELF